MTFEVIGTTADRSNWLGRRRSGFGASEAAILVGESSRHEQIELWAWKCGREPEPDLDGLEYVQWGAWHEASIMAAFAQPKYANRHVARTKEELLAIRNEPIQPFETLAARLLQSPQLHLRSTLYPWALCTLDGWTWHPELEAVPFEVKLAGHYRADQWEDGPPIDEYYQTQQQALVTGAPVVSTACLLAGNRLVWLDVQRDETAIRKIIYYGDRLWRHVQDGTAPPHKPTRTSADILYPPGSEKNGAPLIGESWASVDQELLSIKSEQKRLHVRREELEAELREAIGTRERVVLDTGVAYSWKTQARKESVIPASECRVLRRHEPPRVKG